MAAAAPIGALAQTAPHGSAIWSPAPGSGDWNTAANWVPATVPNGTGDTATLGVSTNTNVALSQNIEVNGITFDATAVNPYTITAAPGTTLTISGAGVANNSGMTQNFVAAGSLLGSNDQGFIIFTGNSNAANAAFTVNGISSGGLQSGYLQFGGQSNAGTSTIHTMSPGTASNDEVNFIDNASAGSAHIIIDGGNSALGGTTVGFEGTSTAANAAITVTGDGLNNINTDGDEGFLVFNTNATAGNATITGNGGRIQFFDQASAGSAIITANNGGIDFGDQTDASQARIILNGSAALDISAVSADTPDGSSAPGGISVGSIEGTGFVRLGENSLTIGTNNLNTTFSGSITEGGREYDFQGGIFAPTYTSGNALIKAGTGALTLSGASTYAGPTTVNDGTLAVTGSLVSAVTVNSGGTLTNSGTIGGLTLASGGTLASTGTPTTLTDTGAASFAGGSTVDLDITAGGASDLIAASGAASLGGATLDITAAPGAYSGQSYTLMTAAGGLTGMFTFVGVTGGSFAAQPTLSYTANSVLLNFAALTTPTHGSDIWKLPPTSGDWNTGANWVSGVVPNGAADTATFDKTSIPAVSLSQNTEVNSIVFNPGAAANPYTITAAPGTTLTISGAGVVNNSGVTQTIVEQSGNTPDQVGVIAFRNSASAGSSTQTTIINNGGFNQGTTIATNTGSFGLFTGGTIFADSSSAGNANIINKGGSTFLDTRGVTQNAFFGGGTFFINNSSAGTSTIESMAGTTAGSAGGYLEFTDGATAASAKITLDGGEATGSSGGSAEFYANATAANSTIIVKGDGAFENRSDVTAAGLTFNETSTAGSANITAEGGSISFTDQATAGNALLTVKSGGLDFVDQAQGGTARVILGSPAVLDISGGENATVVGTTNVYSNVTVNLGSIEGSGFVRLGPNTLAVGTNNLSTMYSGSITDGGNYDDPTQSNIGSLSKVGSGFLTLSGASTYTGGTTVASGTLSVTGSLVSPVTVNSGATLTVSGKVGGVTLAQGGTLASTGTPQTMTVTGSASFASGSTVKLAVTPAGANDQIAVGGAAQLGGATLQVAASPGAYGNQRYTLLSAAGGVSGTFTFAGVNGLGTLSALVTPGLIYSPDSVVLAFQRVQISGETFNERAVAGALNADVLTAPLLVALTTDGLPSNAQLDQASGEIHATLRSALFDDGSLLREATFDRLHSAAAGDNAQPGVALWADVRGGQLALDSDGNAARAHSDEQEFIVGADVGRGAWRFGAAYANNWGEVSVSDRNSSAKWNGDSVIAYAGGSAGPFKLNAGASETWYRLDTHRSPFLPDGASAIDSDKYDARLGQVFGEAAVGAGFGGVHSEVFGRWTGEELTTDAFAENGDATALSGARHSNDLSWSLAGLRCSTPLGNGISFTASAGWAHLFGDATPSAALADSSGTGFLVLGAPLARDSARVSAGVSARVGGEVTVRIGYMGYLGGGNTENAITAAAVVRF